MLPVVLDEDGLLGLELVFGLLFVVVVVLEDFGFDSCVEVVDTGNDPGGARDTRTLAYAEPNTFFASHL